jgi:cytochrome c oxidase assembly factor CtaG
VSHWSWDPSVIGGIAMLALAYRLIPWLATDGSRRERRLRLLCFAAGELVLLLALVSPLDDLADHRSLLAHMIQHLLLLLAVPSLYLAALPASFFASLNAGKLAGFLRPIASPVATFGLATGVLWAWHAPILYEGALRSEPIHAAEHLSFLLAASLFWWPVLRPASHPVPLPELLLVVYLFAAAVSSTVLAALITFSSAVLYPTYLGVMPWLGLAPRDDQQAGGLLMWVVMGLWYFAVAAIVLIRWLDRPTAEGESRSRSAREGALT